MTVPTANQLQRIRSRPHRTRLWLGIYVPDVIATATIDAGVEKTDVEFDVTWTSGDYSLIKEGMTCYIGTSPGAMDIGRIRVRSATATTIKVAESSTNWQKDWYLTVVEFYEPWTVFTRITLDANKVPTFYKDYDIPYTDQNQIFDPIVNMGPHHAGFLTTGSMRVWYTHSGSFDPTPGAVNITGSSFEWWFGEQGFVNPTGTTAQIPGYVDYHSGGYYTTSLKITTPDGKSLTGYRHVMVYDRPNAGPQRPIVKWGLDSLEGSRDDGGYAAKIWIREEAGYSQVVEGALVVIFSDDWQGSAEGAIGGNAENRESILFTGYIDNGSINRDPITNKLSFEVRSIAGVMSQLANYSVSVESEDNAMTWYQVRDMTVDRAIIHLLRWQSTILAVADFAQTGDTRQVQYADFDRGSLYDAANGFLESTIGAQLVADRQGKLWSEIDLNLVPTGSSRAAFRTALSTTNTDWRKSIDFGFEPHSSLAYLELGGIYYSGPSSTGSSAAFLSGAPGDAQFYRGGVQRNSGLVLSSQAQLNELAGNMLARENAEFPEVDVPLAGDYRFIDIAPQERVTMTLAATDTHRGFIWNGKNFITAGVSFDYDPENQIMFTDLSLREETYGEEGASTIDIPEDPPYNSPSLPPWQIEFPPITPFLPPPIPQEIPPTSGQFVYVAYSNVIARCRNIYAPTPHWEQVAVPADISTMTFINGLRLDPNDPVNSAYVWGVGAGGIPIICHTSTLNAPTPTWTKVMTESTANLLLGTAPVIYSMQYWLNGRLLTAAASGQYNCSIGISCMKLLRSQDGTSWQMYQMAPTRNAQECIAMPPLYGVGTIYGGGEFYLHKSINAGVAWAQKQSDPPGHMDPISNPHPSGETIYLRTNKSASDLQLSISTDGGTTLVDYPVSYRGDWAAPNILGGAGYFGYAGDCPINFYLHPVSSLFYTMLNVSSFAIWGGAGYTILHDFNIGASMGPYHPHYGDDSYHYTLTDGNGGEARFQASSDGGYTWASIVGDFATEVMALASLGNRRTIEPVHTV